jgi:hypothetical protein
MPRFWLNWQVNEAAIAYYKYRLILVRIFFSNSLELTADNAEAINPFPFCPNISLNLKRYCLNLRKRVD